MGLSQKRWRWRAILAGCGAACVVVALLAATVGPAELSMSQVLRISLSQIPFMSQRVSVDWGPAQEIIVLKIRLPRVLVAMFVGAGLAAAGVAYQGLFKNPMADPFILGVSPGASLGAALAMVFGGAGALGWLGGGAIPLFAFIGAAAASLVVYNMARVGGRVPVGTLLLSGIAVGSALSAVVSLIMVLNTQSLRELVFWMMGGLSGRGWEHVRMVAPGVGIGTAVIFLLSRELNLMLLGEEPAHHLGVRVETVKLVIILAGALSAGVAVAVSGIIGFVGLVVPHIVRLLVGADHRLLLPTSVLLGATFLTAADMVARILIPPLEVPVGIITALCGGPFFVYLLRTRKKVGAW